jgi:hypothetical protein
MKSAEEVCASNELLAIDIQAKGITL